MLTVHFSTQMYNHYKKLVDAVDNSGIFNFRERQYRTNQMRYYGSILIDAGAMTQNRLKTDCKRIK